MSNIYLVGLERAVADQISRVLSIERHTVRERSHNVSVREFADAGMIFAGGEPALYLSLLRRIRRERPALPVVVVSQVNGTMAWLDALEAGASDYCFLPIQRRQIQWLMESMIPTHAPIPDSRFSRASSARRARPGWAYGELSNAVRAD